MHAKRFLLVFLVLLNSWIGWSYLWPLRKLRVADLPQFYLAAKLARAGKISEIYNQAAYPSSPGGLEAVDASLHWSEYFNRPPFVVVFLLPLAFLSYRAASVLAIVFNLALVTVLVWKLPKWLQSSTDNRIWLFVFMPFLYSVALGQDTLVLTLVVAYGLRLIREGRPVPAGVILAFGLCKPHLIWGIPFALAAGKRWRALLAFAAAACSLFLLSFALVGSRGMLQWVDLLRSPTTDFAPQLMGNVRALGLRFGVPAGALLAVVVLISFGLILGKSESLSGRFAAAILAGLLLSPHTYWQDYSLAAIVALVTRYPPIRYALLIPWPYFYPSLDVLPFTMVSLAAISISAVGDVLKREPRKVT